MDEGQVPDPNDILLAGLNPEEAALRFLAFPRQWAFEAPLPAALTEAARRGLIGAYAEVPAWGSVWRYRWSRL